MNSRCRKMVQLAHLKKEEMGKNDLHKKEPPKIDGLMKMFTNTAILVNLEPRSCIGSENIDADTEKACHKNISATVNQTETLCAENMNYELDRSHKNLDSPSILANETTSFESTGQGLFFESNVSQSAEDCNDLTKGSSSEHEENESTLIKSPNKQQQNILIDDSNSIRDFSPDASEDEYLPNNDKTRKRRLSTSSNSSSSSDSSSSSSSSSSSVSSSSSSKSSSSKKKGKKRTKNEETWKKNVNKKLRITGKQYMSRVGKIVQARAIKPPCGPKCRLSCSNKFTNQQRQNIFDTYWKLGSLQRQRDFLNSCIVSVNPVYRRLKVDAEKHRKPNFTFYLVNDGQNIRVCKQFLLNTLAVTERVLRTISQSKIENSGIISADGRGKHGKQLKTDPEIVSSVRTHIDSIPRIESHYLRANTSREFIDGGLTIAEIHRIYVNERKAIGKVAASYDVYSRIFNKEYNISFFIPKKDQCELCESFKNAVDDKKVELEVEYTHHLEQKKLSRDENKADITTSNYNDNTIVAIYDLQAVMPAPSGDNTAFFYKSKLNCLNLTVTNIKNNVTTCYFWHQALANRGAIEIGTCVYRFLEDLYRTNPNCDVILYSDNCCGQQKNRYLITMYYYAVSRLPIQSITHKFLIPGHTQNEGDNAHSVIEKAIKRAKKSGPIYIPDQYAQIIRTAKKTGHPYVVVEMDFKDFYELKTLNDEVKLNMTKSVNGYLIKITEIKMIRFTKDSDIYTYKTDYAKDWIEVKCHKIPRGSQRNTDMAKNVKTISLQQAYMSKIGIDGRLKSDLQYLIGNNIVPSYYARFYEDLFKRDDD